MKDGRRDATATAAAAAEGDGKATGAAGSLATPAKEPPMPMSALEVLSPYEILLQQVESGYDRCHTESEFETTERTHTKQKIALKQLLDGLKTLRVDMVNKDKASKSAEVQASKRKAVAEDKGSASSKGSKLARSNTATLLVDHSFTVAEQMMVFPTLAAFAAFDKKEELLLQPWLIRGGREISENFRADEVVKTEQQAFMSEFMGSDQEKKGGRAMWFIENGQRAKLGSETKKQLDAVEQKLEMVKFGKADLATLSAEQQRAILSDTLFAFASQMRFSGGEFLQMGSLRVHVDGAKRIALAPYAEVRKLFEKECKVANPHLILGFNAVLDYFKGTHDSKTIAQMREFAGLKFVVASGGDVLYTPPCYLVQETTHQSLRGWGFRRPVLPQADPLLGAFTLLAEDLQSCGKVFGHVACFAKLMRVEAGSS